MPVRKVVIIAVSIISIVLVVVAIKALFFNQSVDVSTEDIAIRDRQAQLEVLNQAVIEARKIDADLDGISDRDEITLGTNSAEADTDHDGILDYDEINLYKSDPLSADSDGDGLKDGYEVLRGYSPIGSGKL